MLDREQLIMLKERKEHVIGLQMRAIEEGKVSPERMKSLNNPLGKHLQDFWISSYLLGEPFEKSLKGAKDCFSKYLAFSRESTPLTVRRYYLFHWVICDETRADNLDILASPDFSELLASIYDLSNIEVIQSFTLANYLLERHDSIIENKQSFMEVEEKWGGDSEMYSCWTKAIVSLLEKDEPGLSEALESILTEHTWMRDQGSLQDFALGELCLPALAFLKLARKAGMNIELENPLVPRELVELKLNQNAPDEK